jgi:hypothetical protein
VTGAGGTNAVILETELCVTVLRGLAIATTEVAVLNGVFDVESLGGFGVSHYSSTGGGTRSDLVIELLKIG